MTPHTLVGGAQTTLITATASARADRRDCPSEAWGPRGKTHPPPLDALDRRAGGAGAVGTAPKRLVPSDGTRVGKGLISNLIRTLIIFLSLQMLILISLICLRVPGLLAAPAMLDEFVSAMKWQASWPRCNGHRPRTRANLAKVSNVTRSSTTPPMRSEGTVSPHDAHRAVKWSLFLLYTTSNPAL